MTDIVKARRESMRWLLSNTLNNARPLGAMHVLLLSVVQALAYLEDKGLVDIKRQPDGHWHSVLSSDGIDVVEYTIDCPAGIARPAKYWG